MRSGADHKVDDLQERLMQRFAESSDDAERAHLARRFCRLFCASLERSNRKTAQAEAMSASGMMVSMVFDALDTALLEDRAGLRALLRAKSIRYCALEAIARIGPPAREFAGSLLETLDAPEAHWYFDGAKALAAIGRDDPYLVDELFQRLKEGDDDLKGRTASVFYHLGPNLAGRLEEVLAFLLEGTRHRGDLLVSLTATLGSVGRDRPEALARLLDLAAPRPPRLRSLPEFPEHPYDEVMYERGAAIDALAFFPSFPRRVVPVLSDAFDSFEEYDPDNCYGGERVRVCSALEAFGPAALPVVPTLVKYLEAWLTRPEDDRTSPGDVFRLLAKMGPEARAALPALWTMRSCHGDTEDEPLDRSEPLDRAILAIEGRPV